MSEQVICLPPTQPDTRPTFRCRYFGCAWEFKRKCCWVYAECSLCERRSGLWRYAQDGCSVRKDVDTSKLTIKLEADTKQAAEAIDELSKQMDALAALADRTSRAAVEFESAFVDVSAHSRPTRKRTSRPKRKKAKGAKS